MKGRKLCSILFIVPVILSLCGFSLFPTSVEVDTENHRVYEYVTADELLSDFTRDTVDAEAKYKGGYYLVAGQTESVSKTGDILRLTGTSVREKQIICSCPMKMRADALEYQAGDVLGVFGKLNVDLIDKDIHLSVDELAESPFGAKPGSFYLKDGTGIEKNSMSKRSLHNGEVSYYIPAGWKGVEHSIAEEGLGIIEGYQYVLNQLPGNTDTLPESFFVCYFENASGLKYYRDDRNETVLIEKAIIDNISGEGAGDSARRRDVTTYYGARYNYYTTSYSDALDAGGNGYRAEYIFQKDGENGFVMYLYIYKQAKHLSDVLFVTRFLELPPM